MEGFKGHICGHLINPEARSWGTLAEFLLQSSCVVQSCSQVLRYPTNANTTHTPLKENQLKGALTRKWKITA